MMKKAVAILVLLTTVFANADAWRTDGNGCYPDASLPSTWSEDDGVVWKKELPTWSNASPVIDGDRIFVCMEPDILICLSKKDGTELWRAQHSYESFLTAEEQAKSAELAPKIKTLQDTIKKLRGEMRKFRKIKDAAERKEKEAPFQKQLQTAQKELAEAEKYAPPKTHNVNGFSSPTPACNGKYVFVVFGTGIAACHTIDGEKKWAKKIGKPTNGMGHCGSPVIIGNKAIAKITDVLAFDLETGKELWKVPGKQVFGSCVTTKVDGKDLVVTAEGRVIAADDGKVLAEGLHKLAYCSPIAVDGIAYFIENGGKAFRLTTEEGKQPEELWKTEPNKDRYYGSPVLHDGLIYAVTRASHFSVIDAKDGKVIFDTKLKMKGTCYPSPAFAGGRIIVSSDSGEMTVFEPGREPKEVAVNALEPFRSSPVFEGSRMYIRGLKNMYCIGK